MNEEDWDMQLEVHDTVFLECIRQVQRLKPRAVGESLATRRPLVASVLGGTW